MLGSRDNTSDISCLRRLLPHPFHEDSHIPRSTVYANCPDPLLEGVYTIILGVLDTDPGALHEVFSFAEFTLFITGHDFDQLLSYVRETGLSAVFEMFTSKQQYPLSDRYEFQMDSRIECMAKFLSTGDDMTMSRIVTYILDGLRKYTLHDPQRWSDSVTSHVGSLLNFSARLCLMSKPCARSFLSSEILSVIELLWIRSHAPSRARSQTLGHSSPVGNASSSKTMLTVRIGCVMFLCGLSSHFGRYVSRAILCAPFAVWFLEAQADYHDNGCVTKWDLEFSFPHLACSGASSHVQHLTVNLMELCFKTINPRHVNIHPSLYKYVFDIARFAFLLTSFIRR